MAISNILLFPTHPVKTQRAAIEARLEAARRARGCAYTAKNRHEAIIEYLAALRELVELDYAEATRG